MPSGRHRPEGGPIDEHSIERGPRVDEIIASGIASVLLIATTITLLRPSNVARSTRKRAWLLISAALFFASVPNCLRWWREAVERTNSTAELPWVWPALALSLFIMAWAASTSPPFRGVHITGRWRNRPGWRPDDLPLPFRYSRAFPVGTAGTPGMNGNPPRTWKARRNRLSTRVHGRIACNIGSISWNSFPMPPSSSTPRER